MKQDANLNSFINPEPYTIVSCRDKDGKDNALSIGFVANVGMDPTIIMIAVREERYSHHIIKESGEFVVNITTVDLEDQLEYLGIASGRDEDKLADIETIDADIVDAPLIENCPVNFECIVTDSITPGSHEVFFGKVVKVHCDEEYLKADKSIKWTDINLLHS